MTTFDDLALSTGEKASRLAGWFADLLGEPIAPLQDLSGGRWRDSVGLFASDRPPSQAWMERRKFLLQTETGPWLLKFAGLGRIGLSKLERARALAGAGFCPEPAGWRHGFLAEPWLRAPPLTSAASRSVDRPALVSRIGAYLGFRARFFPAPPDAGASLDDLVAMARRNAGLALGEAQAARLDELRPLASRLARYVNRVETDNRLQLWEWLDGQQGFLKTDALDHHAGHDLIGAQDVAWDIVGASVEFDLSPEECERLTTMVERACARSVPPSLLSLLRPCYLAFQVGAWTVAGSRASRDEELRTEATVDRYRTKLADTLERALPDAVTNL